MHLPVQPEQNILGLQALLFDEALDARADDLPLEVLCGRRQIGELVACLILAARVERMRWQVLRRRWRSEGEVCGKCGGAATGEVRSIRAARAACCQSGAPLSYTSFGSLVSSL